MALLDLLVVLLKLLHGNKGRLLDAEINSCSTTDASLQLGLGAVSSTDVFQYQFLKSTSGLHLSVDLEVSTALEVFAEVHKGKGSCHERECLCIMKEVGKLAGVAPGLINKPAHRTATSQHIMPMRYTR